MMWTDAQKQTAESLWRDGYSATEIARVIDPHGSVSRSSVMGVIHRMGLSNRDRVMRIRAAQKPPKPRSDKPRVKSVAKTPRETFFSPIEVIAAPEGGVKFLDIQSGQCRWPVGGQGFDAFRFCGAPVDRGSYCAGHYRLSVGPGTPSERAAFKGLKKHMVTEDAE